MDGAEVEIARILLLIQIERYGSKDAKPLPQLFRRMRKQTLNLEKSLQKYADYNWIWQLQAVSRNHGAVRSVSRLLEHFLRSEVSRDTSSQMYQAWMRELERLDKSYIDLVAVKDLLPSTNAIFAVYAFGFHSLLPEWWNSYTKVTVTNEQGLDGLAIAARYNHVDLCRALVNKGSDVNRSLRNGKTSALQEAISEGSVEALEFLLSESSHPPFNGEQAVSCAAKSRRMVEMLLDRKMDPNARCVGCEFSCALAKAAYFGDTEVARLLIGRGADVNFPAGDGDLYGSPLAAAVRGGHVEAMKLLIDHGADVNAPLKHGGYGSALAAAAEGLGGVEVIKLLIEHGADVNAPLEYGDFGSALAAALFARSDALPKVKYLVEEAQADPSLPDSNPPTATAEELVDEENQQAARYLAQQCNVKSDTIEKHFQL